MRPVAILFLATISTLPAAEIVRGPDLPQSRAAHTLTALPDGRILVAGGFSGSSRTPVGATIYSAPARSFQPAAPMREPRYGHTATALPDGSVLIAGGWNARGDYLASTERFDPNSGRFLPLPDLPAARAGHVAIALTDGRVLLAGGVGTGWEFLASAEIFDPASGRFSRTGSMSVARENHAAARLADGRVLITGGHTGRGAAVRIHASAEIFDPGAGTFSPAGTMLSRRHKHDSVLLADGRILLTGGSATNPGATTPRKSMLPTPAFSPPDVACGKNATNISAPPYACPTAMCSCSAVPPRQSDSMPPPNAFCRSPDIISLPTKVTPPPRWRPTDTFSFAEATIRALWRVPPPG